MVASTATTAWPVERECLSAAAVVAVGAAAATVMLWASTFPGWPIAAGVVLSVLVIAGVMVVMGTEPHPAARWLRPAGLAAALIVTIGGGALIHQMSPVALQVRFAQSRPAFESVVASAGPVPREVSDRWLPYSGDCPARIGSYRIAECHAFAGGFMFLQKRNALGDEAGFAYAPDGLRSTDKGRAALPIGTFSHIDGPWYAWNCGC